MARARKQPAFQFYPGDWKKDPALSMCALSTRAVWLELLCAMHEIGEGEVTGTIAQLARLCSCLPTEMAAALAELESTGAADVTGFPRDICVTCHADVTGSHALVTVESRRLSRQYGETAKARERKRLQRERESEAQTVTPDVTEKSRPPSSSSSSSSSSEDPPIAPQGAVSPGGIDDDLRMEDLAPSRQGYRVATPASSAVADQLKRHRSDNLRRKTPPKELQAYCVHLGEWMDGQGVSRERAVAAARWLADGGDLGTLSISDARGFTHFFSRIEQAMTRPAMPAYPANGRADDPDVMAELRKQVGGRR